MLGIFKDFIGASVFYNLTEIHNSQSVAQLAYSREIMGYEKIGYAELLLQIHQQIEYLRVDRHIKCADRFITDKIVGL